MPCKEQLRGFAVVERFEKDFANSVRLVVVWEMEGAAAPDTQPAHDGGRPSCRRSHPARIYGSRGGHLLVAAVIVHLPQLEPVLATRETGAL